MTNFQATDADIGADLINTRTMWPTLSGRLHAAIRILWIAWAIVALTVFVASLPAYLGGVAPHSANPEAAGQFTAGQTTLVTQSLDVASAVASITAAIISLGLATLLFLRKSNDGMAMFVSFLMLTYGIVLAGPLERLGLIWEPARDLVHSISHSYIAARLSISEWAIRSQVDALDSSCLPIVDSRTIANAVSGYIFHHQSCSVNRNSNLCPSFTSSRNLCSNLSI